MIQDDYHIPDQDLFSIPDSDPQHCKVQITVTIDQLGYLFTYLCFRGVGINILAWAIHPPRHTERGVGYQDGQHSSPGYTPVSP
jgi:hypothetical protein